MAFTKVEKKSLVYVGIYKPVAVHFSFCCIKMARVDLNGSTNE